MNKFAEALGDIGLHNPHNYASGKPYISFQAYQEWSRSNGWNLSWGDRTKNFSLFGSDRATVLEEAKTWASERFGIKEWARTPFNSLMDAEFVKSRNKELKEQLKAIGASA